MPDRLSRPVFRHGWERRHRPPARLRPRILQAIKALLLAGGIASVAVVVSWDTDRPPRLAAGPADAAGPPGHVMSGAVLVGTDREGRRYRIRAAEVFEETGTVPAVRLDTLHVRFFSGTREVSLMAGAGRYHLSERRMSVSGGMRMKTQDGTVLETESSAYFPERGLLEGVDPVRVDGSWGTVEARGYRYDTVSGTLSFTGRPVLRFAPAGQG